MILASDTHENMPRIGFEAMASGTILVTDDRGGWKLQIDNGKTGYLCNSTLDFIEKSTHLAHHDDLRKEMRHNAKEKLENEWGLEASMKSWEKVFNEWESIK